MEFSVFSVISEILSNKIYVSHTLDIIQNPFEFSIRLSFVA